MLNLLVACGTTSLQLFYFFCKDCKSKTTKLKIDDHDQKNSIAPVVDKRY